MPPRLSDVFRDESGAFDLPSILVGVVVVGILTAGVLAAIFGVIPFSQDKGAQQDLDGLRTAEGVAKAKDGAFKPFADLADAGYLPVSGKVAAGTDATGSCYAGVVLSGSGKLFVATDQKPAPDELVTATSPGCLSIAQLKTLVTAVGGEWPGGAEASVTFTPFVAGGNLTNDGAALLNGYLAFQGSPEVLHAMQTMDPVELNALGGQLNALFVAATPEANEQLSYVMAQNPDLKAAKNAADFTFMGDPTVANQQTSVDAWYTWFQAGIPTLP